MFRRQSASVLEMPGTPLLGPGQVKEAGFNLNGEDGAFQPEPSASASHSDDNNQRPVSRKKKWAY